MATRRFEFTVNGHACACDLGRGRRRVAVALALAATALLVPCAARAVTLDDLFAGPCGVLAGEVGKVFGVFYQSNTLMNGFDTLLGSDDASGTLGKVLETVEFAQSATIKPIAATVLALAILLQLLKISQRMDANAQMPALREVLGLFVFCACYLYVLRNCTELARGVFALFKSVAFQFSPGNGKAMDQETLSNLISANVDGAEGTTVLFIALLFAWGAALFSVVSAVAASYGRGIQIYLMTLFAPLALAFLALDETRQWGVGFVKSYCATCLTATIILFFMWVGPYLLVGTAITAGDWLPAVIKIIAVSGLMGAGITSSGKYAREILGG